MANSKEDPITVISTLFPAPEVVISTIPFDKTVLGQGLRPSSEGESVDIMGLKERSLLKDEPETKKSSTTKSH